MRIEPGTTIRFPCSACGQGIDAVVEGDPVLCGNCGVGHMAWRSDSGADVIPGAPVESDQCPHCGGVIPRSGISRVGLHFPDDRPGKFCVCRLLGAACEVCRAPIAGAAIDGACSVFWLRMLQAEAL